DLRLGMPGYHPFHFALAEQDEQGDVQLISSVEQWPMGRPPLEDLLALRDRALNQDHPIAIDQLAGALARAPANESADYLLSCRAVTSTWGSPLCTHSRQMASSSDISTGPTNSPTIPMVVTPPIRPKKVSRKGSLIGPPTSDGRMVLSTMNSSTAPQMNSATPAKTLPLPTR